jgi:hypothetical protein
VFAAVRKEVGRDDPRAIYPKVTDRIIDVIRGLIALPHHVILIGQIDPGDTSDAGSFGHILAVSGKAKTLIPAMIQDWLWLDTRISKKTLLPRSRLLLAPQGAWTKGSRSIQGIKSMPADFTEFLRLSKKGKVTKEDLPNDIDEDDGRKKPIQIPKKWKLLSLSKK